MPKYVIDITDTNTDNTTIGYLSSHATTPRRTKLYDAIISSNASPADATCRYEFQAITAENGAPGGTALTARPLDPADAAATNKPREAVTGEPTYTAGAYYLRPAVNQRATFRWVAAPGGEIVTPAVADDGVGVQADTPAPSAYSATVTLHFEE